MASNGLLPYVHYLVNGLSGGTITTAGLGDEHMRVFDIRFDVGTDEPTFTMRKSPEKRYVPVKAILEHENIYSLAEELIAAGHAFTDSVGSLAKNLQKVNNIKQVVLPTVEIGDAVELTEVAEIFKRLNSTGTRIQQADIYLGVVASKNPGWVNQKFLKFLDELENGRI